MGRFVGAYGTGGVGEIWGSRGGGSDAFAISSNMNSFHDTSPTLFKRISGDVQGDINKMLAERAKWQIAALKRYLRQQVDRNPGVGKTGVPGLFDERNPLSDGHPGRLIADNIGLYQDDSELQVFVPQIFGSRDIQQKLDYQEALDQGWGSFKVKIPHGKYGKGKVLRTKHQKKRGKLAKNVISSTLFYAKGGGTQALMPVEFMHPGYPAYNYKEWFHAGFLRNLEKDFEKYIEEMKLEGRYRYGDFNASKGEKVPESSYESKKNRGRATVMAHHLKEARQFAQGSMGGTF